MSADRHGSLLLAAALLFLAGSAAGTGFALLGPVPLVKLLGAFAGVAGLAGAALQVYALRRFHPHTYESWVQRTRATFGKHTIPHTAHAAHPAAA